MGQSRSPFDYGRRKMRLRVPALTNVMGFTNPILGAQISITEEGTNKEVVSE